MEVLGIDIGGSGIKASVVETDRGELLTEVYSADSHQIANVEIFKETLHSIIQHFDWSGPIGAGFPGVVQRNVILTAPHLDSSFIGVNLEELLLDLGAFEAAAINEADAAGIAEMHFGAGRNKVGTNLMITVGTGLGTALFYRNTLIPNMELGHAEFRGVEAESFVSNRARIDQKMNWKTWGNDLNGYLNYVAALLSVDTIILGGGSMRSRHKFEEYISLPCEYVFAEFEEKSGIVGAALAIDS